MSVILEMFLSISSAVIYVALYFLVFEMEASKVILNSITFEKFKTKMRLHKIVKNAVLSAVVLF